MKDVASARDRRTPLLTARLLGGLAGLNGIAAGISFIGQLLAARTLGPEAYGHYNVVLATSSLVALASTFGLNIALTRLVGLRHGLGQPLALAPPLLTGTLLGLLGAIVQLLIQASNGNFVADPAASLLAVLLVPLMTATSIGAGILTGLSRPMFAVLASLLLREAGVVVFIVTVPLAGVATGVWTPLLGACIGCVLGLLLSLRAVSLRPTVPSERAAGESLAEILPHIREAAPVAIYSFMFLVLNRLDLLLAPYYLEASDDVGAYALAARCADVVMLAQVAANSVCGPRIVTLYNHKDFRELEAFSIRIARLTLLLGVGVAAPLLLFAGEFLSIFGSEFSQGISVLRILLIGKVAALSFGISVMLHLMANFSWRVVVIIGGAIVADLILIPLLATWFGIAGLASATALSLVLVFAAASVSIRRIIGVRSSAFSPRTNS